MWNFQALQCSYAGLQYHASMALSPQIIHVSGGLKIVAPYPGGAKGTWLNLCGPSKTWYAGSWGWVRDFRSILNVSCNSLISLHHIIHGKISSHVLRPVILCFLKVCISRCALLTRWMCGSTKCSFIFSFSRYLLTAFEATFYMMLKIVFKPLFVRYLMFSLNVAIVEVYVRYFNGVSNIAFDDQLYITKIAVFLSLDPIGNFPV